MSKKAQNSNGSSNCKSRPGRQLKPVKDGVGSRNQRRAEEVQDTADAMSKSNPYAWYNSFPQFARDAATIPFAMPLGATMQSIDGTNFSVPGLMRLRFTPTFGVSADYSSPINRSSIRYWTQLRSIQKASAAYDHQDVTMMILAMDSAYMFHALGRRIYGQLNAWTPVNRYYPRSLMVANGIDYDDIRQNIVDFRAYLNSFAYNLGQYPLPKDITLFDRHEWMCTGYYVDSNATKAQTYMFAPQGFWQYDNTVETGSQLVWKDWLGTTASPSRHTFAEFVAFGNSLLNALSNDQDFTYIAGDMRALYGDNVHTLPYTEEDYRILPLYDETVLSQIENCTLAGPWAPNYTPVVSQNPSVNEGALVFSPLFKPLESSESALDTRLKKYINMHIDSPTPEAVMEATRLKFASDPLGGETVVITACGTEIVNSMDIFIMNPDSTVRFLNHDSSALTILTGENLFTEVSKISLVTQFDWAPMLEVWATNAAGNSQFTGFIADLDNFTPLKDDYLAVIHEAALYSLFDVKTPGSKPKEIGQTIGY